VVAKSLNLLFLAENSLFAYFQYPEAFYFLGHTGQFFDLLTAYWVFEFIEVLLE